MLKHYLTIYVGTEKNQETICLNNLESFYNGRIRHWAAGVKRYCIGLSYCFHARTRL